MMRYINDADNLMMLMRLLKGSSKTIQAEAFHVFKVFVANPNKSDGVNAIFKANRDRLIAFLKAFKLEKGIVLLRRPLLSARLSSNAFSAMRYFHIFFTFFGIITLVSSLAETEQFVEEKCILLATLEKIEVSAADAAPSAARLGRYDSSDSSAASSAPAASSSS